jgi:uncharacterized membrane protein
VAHDHGPAAPASRQLRLILAGILIPAALVIAALMVLLHGGGGAPRLPSGLGPRVDLVHADIIDSAQHACPTGGDDTPADDQSECLTLHVRLTSGPHRGTTTSFDVQSTRSTPIPHRGGIVVSYDPTAEAGDQYAFADIQRGHALTLLFLVFALAVVAVARWTGLRALIGLGASLAVLLGFVLPALLAGRGALPVALVGSSAVLFLVLFIAHGVNVRTSIAVVGTLTSLLLCGALAQLFVVGTALTGLGSDEADLLSATVRIDLRGLLLAGVVIGALGAVVDMTVTQSTAVWQLHAANPAASFTSLYHSAMHIGRDHVAAATTTLVLAYVGTSLPLLVVYQLARTDLTTVVTGETVAAEIVRTLVGSLGLVAAVPVTTALAALAVRADAIGSRVHRHARREGSSWAV